jgi:predicted nucleic acid-binding protein
MEQAMSEPLPRVYLDANVFIAAFEHVGAHSDHAWWIIRAIETGKVMAGTSEITLAEILVKPLERGDTDLADGYEKMIVPGPHFEVLPVRRDILRNAAVLRARRASVRLPDAIHIASAETLTCRFFVSDDRRLPLPEGMRKLAVDPFTLDDVLTTRPS